MFHSDTKSSKPPLLMAASDAKTAGQPDHDQVYEFRRSRKKRSNRLQKPLTAAFAAQPGQNDTIAQPPSAAADDSPQQPSEPVGAPPAAPSPVIVANDTGYPPQTLIDPAVVIDTVWRWKWPIMASTVLGGLLGIGIALSTPREYTAFTGVLLDPREIRLIERDLTPEFLANEAALAIIDSQLQSAMSTPVLERVIERTGLTRDPEFNGEGEGARGAITIIGGLLSGGSDTAGGVKRVTLENLRSNLTADRTARTFIINIGATSRNPEKSALLANEVAQSFIAQQGLARSESARDATQAITGRLDDLRQAVESAERRVETHRQENNLFNAQGRLISEDEVIAVNGALTRARSATNEARAQADAARSAGLDAVVSGVLPTTLVTPALTTFRAQYASLKQQLASLENQLGPRHPRLENLRESVGAAERDIQTELRRIVAGTQADLRAAIQTEQQTAQQLALLKARLSDNADEIVTLRELEREASAAREIYEAALRRARETGEIEATPTQNARIVSPAEVPLVSSSTSRKLIVMASAFAGFALAFGLALASGVLKGFRSRMARRSDDNRVHMPAGPPVAPNDPKGPFQARALFSKKSSTAYAKDNSMYPPYPPYAPYPMHPQPMAGYVQQPYATPSPVMAPHPYAPMPQMAAAPHYAPQQVQPIVVPIMAQPIHTAAPAVADQHPQTAAQNPQAAHSAEDEREMEELRASVRDIREMVDILAQRRYG